MIEPVVSVVLPIREGRDIAWLALKGLARQYEAPPWELLVGEETCGERVLGECALREWATRLRAAGMVYLGYRAYAEPCGLNQKVWDLTQAASESSGTIVYLGCDDLPHPRRLRASHDAIVGGAHLYQEREGIYLNLDTGKVAMYDAAVGRSSRQAHLNMSIGTEIAKTFPMDMGEGTKTDRIFFARTKDAVERSGLTFVLCEVEHWCLGGLATHGRNHVITGQRGRLIDECLPPFRRVDDEPPCGVPEDIWARLQAMVRND
mgnify:CR=1 FL=1